MSTPNTINDGGFAFASGDPTHGGNPGMSLRAYFAGQALAGILHEYKTSETAYWQIAKEAVSVADALIAELNKTQP